MKESNFFEEAITYCYSMRFSKLLFMGLSVTMVVGRPHSEEYIAFSLNRARHTIETNVYDQDFRLSYPKTFNFYGINKISGMVFDRKAKDIILVGRHDPVRPPLTLDDFVISLRAKFVYGEWPKVSIDPTEETEMTNLQTVRFEGGIENTYFGETLFEADYQLKNIGIGFGNSSIPGVECYWDLSVARLINESTGSHQIDSRFWFYPITPDIQVRDDVVAIMKGVKIGVFTEVLSAEMGGKLIENVSTFRDDVGDDFAQSITDNFALIAEHYPSFSRLQGLVELVALSQGISNMEDMPDLSFWLTQYNVQRINTKEKIEVVKREQDYILPGGHKSHLVLSGGVVLVAIALNLKAGDATALRDAVLKTRPSNDASSWTFTTGEWLIPTAPGMVTLEDIIPLFTQVEFLYEHKRYTDAAIILNNIIEVQPSWAQGYYNRGVLFAEQGYYDKAIVEFDKAIEINPVFYKAFFNRAVVNRNKGQFDKAFRDYNKVIALNPTHFQSYVNRGALHHDNKDFDLAISDYTTAIELNPNFAGAYSNRGQVYNSRGLLDSAYFDYTKAIELDPTLAEAYSNRGIYFEQTRQYEKAINDFTTAIKLNPRKFDAYADRGLVYKKMDDPEKAIEDFTKALEIKPDDVTTYYHRGMAYLAKGFVIPAISDFSKAIELSPNLATMYSNRGSAYSEIGMFNNALSDFDKAIELDPTFAIAYYNKAHLFERMGRVSKALTEYRHFINNATEKYSEEIELARERIRMLQR